jgi:glycolate oxidase FAD binding subunit
MVAAGLAGPARASVGTVRDFVLGIRVLNGQGEDLTFGGQVMKNVAGYDVSRLMAGSLGQLALITEVSLKVLPLAPSEATLACAGMTQAVALALLHRWGAQPLPLNASAWVQDTLYIRLRGAIAAVASAIQKMTDDAKTLGASVTHMGDEAIADWQASAEQTLPFFAQAPSADACLWRLSVPQTTPDLASLGISEASYIEWHGAQRWIWAPAARAEFLRQITRQVGGHATLFKTSALHGEADKSVGVFSPLEAVQQRIQTQLKKQFDPAGVFNPGRV